MTYSRRADNELAAEMRLALDLHNALIRIIRSRGVPPEFESWREARKNLAEPKHDLIKLFASETTAAIQIALHVASLQLQPKHRSAWDFLCQGNGKLPRPLRIAATPFCWPLRSLDHDLVSVVDQEFNTINDTGIPPKPPHDLYSELVEQISSQSIRHKRGAYYTPSWLARHVVASACDQLDGLLFTKRVLEPASGTGAFVVALWDRARALLDNQQISVATAVNFFQQNLLCIERDPLSALATEANLIRALLDIDPEQQEKRAPCSSVIQADTINETYYEGLRNQGELNLREAPPRSFYQAFDLVIGNPPWISWENLEPRYRQRTAFIWELLGLFSSSGSKKAFSKEDFSTLFTYVVADQYLACGGKLALILPQSQFQSSLNGRGFRRFIIAHSSIPLRVDAVHDFRSVPVFKGAAAKAAVLFLTKGSATLYPIRYEVYSGAKEESRSCTVATATPSDPTDIQSQWSVSASQDAQATFFSVRGKSPYRARTGVFTGGANAAFYLKECSLHGDMVRATTASERAKRHLPERQIEIEQHLVYPFLRGRDVEFWRSHLDLSRGILLPHSIETGMYPIPSHELESSAPAAFKYLQTVRGFLDGRRGLTAMDKANCDRGFYSVLRVGPYTFAPFKVVWRYIHSEFTCCVVERPSEGPLAFKPVVPQEKLVMIPFLESAEAHFVCGFLSSTPIRDAIHARMVSTQISASIIDQLAIPKYDKNHPGHRLLSDTCKAGHAAAAKFDSAAVDGARKKIDQITREILNSRNRDTRMHIRRRVA